MRLLKADSIELVQFLPNQIPPYAILSHTWSANPDEEVLFSDIGKGEAKQKPAYQQKVAPACKKALGHGFDYVWIDTCCIDKSSSAELQEAVNSMFKWYLHSSICFVYLGDVRSERDPLVDLEKGDNFITRSRWFARGWTLQELIAPENVIFYCKLWTKLGTRVILADLISKKTKIDAAILRTSSSGHLQFNLFSRSIANRMSWAAFRETTRPEDFAYCLLGLFDVNMPLLYGEGEEKAFRRLQEEIFKNSDDQSLLAWTASSSVRGTPESLQGPLASHPSAFQHAGNIVPLSGIPETYLLTSSGLRIALLLVPTNYLPFEEGVWGVLRCHYKNDFTGPLAIPLKPQSWQGSHVYARRCADLITIDRFKLSNHDIFQNGPFGSTVQAHPQNQTIVIHRKPESWNPDCENLHLESWPRDCTLIRAIPEKHWDSKSQIMVSDGYDVTRAFIFDHVDHETEFAVIFEYSFRFPDPTLGKVKVLELTPEVLESHPWLHDKTLDPTVDMQWSERNPVNQIDPLLWLRLDRPGGPRLGIRAALRKGHIMGVPFFVVNVQTITNFPYVATATIFS